MLDKKKVEDQLIKTKEFLKKELGSMRTGRANPSLVESIEVEAYGSNMKLKEMATITTPDAKTVRVEPWDKGQMNAIKKAIQVSDLGLNPADDGSAAIIKLPELTGERREEIAKSVNAKVEEAKVSARNTREEFLKEMTDKNSSGELSDDDFEKAKKDLQKLIDDCNTEIIEMGDKKREEILNL